MVNYESLILTTNEELRKQAGGLYIVYPYDGLSISDAPLGYIDKGDSKKEENFLKLKTYCVQKYKKKCRVMAGVRALRHSDENRKLWEKNPALRRI